MFNRYFAYFRCDSKIISRTIFLCELLPLPRENDNRSSKSNRPISRYRHQYGSKVNRNKKKHKQDVIAFVNTVTQFIHRGSYAHIVTVITEEVFVNLSVRKIIYDYMYLVNLENNERSCEYSAILWPKVLPHVKKILI